MRRSCSWCRSGPEVRPMSSIMALPHRLLHRTRWGGRLLRLPTRSARARRAHRALAVDLGRGAATGYPEAYMAWLRFAALAAAGEAARAASPHGGGDDAG